MKEKGSTMKQQNIFEPSAIPPAAPSISSGPMDTATLELLAKWRQDDATQSPEEILAAERDLQEFKQAMNESRAKSGEPPLFP
jgi:hypothetical protein